MAALGLTRNKGQGLCPEGSSSAHWALGGLGQATPKTHGVPLSPLSLSHLSNGHDPQ